MLHWSRTAAGGAGIDIPDIGATSSVDISRFLGYGIVIDCSINWVPVGNYSKAR